MAEVASAAPSSKGAMHAFLVTMAVGWFVRLLASLVTLVFSFRSMAQSFAIAEDPGLDPHDKAARLKDSINTATGWTQAGLLVWPIGSVLLCGIAVAIRSATNSGS